MSLNSIRFNRARITDYFVDEPMASNTNGPEVVIDQRIACLSFQGVVTSGAPKGTLKAQLSIIDGVWTDLAGCAPIKIDLSEHQDFLMIIPDQTAYAGKLRLSWTPEFGSNGTLTVAQRVMLP
tara:strand:- start:191 stop:559 length:369 start_codon:yes stop_codon:yes gene_type:complete